MSAREALIHDVAVVTDGVLQTYSWGDTSDEFTIKNWNNNKPEDLVAALEALSKGLVREVSDDSLGG